MDGRSLRSSSRVAMLLAGRWSAHLRPMTALSGCLQSILKTSNSKAELHRESVHSHHQTRLQVLWLRSIHSMLLGSIQRAHIVPAHWSTRTTWPIRQLVHTRPREDQAPILDFTTKCRLLRSKQATTSLGSTPTGAGAVSHASALLDPRRATRNALIILVTFGATFSSPRQSLRPAVTSGKQLALKAVAMDGRSLRSLCHRRAMVLAPAGISSALQLRSHAPRRPATNHLRW